VDLLRLLMMDQRLKKLIKLSKAFDSSLVFIGLLIDNSEVTILGG